MRNVRKSVAVIGESETMWFYINGLQQTKRYPFKIVPDFPQYVDLDHMRKLVDTCLSKGYDYVVCLVDMDTILDKAKTQKRYESFQKEYTKKKYQGRVRILETNPCTEFWFLLHFFPISSFKKQTSKQDVIHALRNHLSEYERTKKYFIKSRCFQKLFEGKALNVAIANAIQLYNSIPEESKHSVAYTQIHDLFQILKDLNK